jgi:hypothetical protein
MSTECNYFISDIDECSLNTDGCDQLCINTFGSFICSCLDGYGLNKDNKSCDDIDECAEKSDNCPPELTCNNNEGSFECV